MPSIKISPKHGVNPSIAKCFLCGKDTGEIVLPGRLKGDVQAPHSAVWTKEPCSQCKEYQKQGVILISVRDGEDGSENPYRTGGWVVVTEDYLQRVISTDSILTTMLKHRVAFVPETAWNMIGLPPTSIS